MNDQTGPRTSLGLVEVNLRETVRYLSQEIGPRSYLDVRKLTEAADYIEARFRSSGCRTARQPFTLHGDTYYNVIAERGGPGDGILVIGAHYDTVVGTPGADDNASGVAGLLELARLSSENPSQRVVRYVAFSLEEPPAYMTSRMGSFVYAKSLSDGGVKVYGMISLEMLGYFSDRPGSQYYPSSLFKLFYPGRGDFIAFVGNLSSRPFTRKVKDAFKSASTLPVQSLNTFSLVPGVDFSDHRSFWKFGYPAFMVTDTAFYRNPHYHTRSDAPEILDYGRMAELVTGLHKALRDI